MEKFCNAVAAEILVPTEIFLKKWERDSDEIAAGGYNIDLCGYPHEEVEIPRPMDLINQYQEKRAALNAGIDDVLGKIAGMLGK